MTDESTRVEHRVWRIGSLNTFVIDTTQVDPFAQFYDTSLGVSWHEHTVNETARHHLLEKNIKFAEVYGGRSGSITRKDEIE